MPLCYFSVSEEFFAFSLKMREKTNLVKPVAKNIFQKNAMGKFLKIAPNQIAGRFNQL